MGKGRAWVVLLFALDARLTSSAHSDAVKRLSITMAYAFAY